MNLVGQAFQTWDSLPGTNPLHTERRAVEGADYQVLGTGEEEEDALERDRHLHQEHLKQLKRKIIFGAAIGILVLIGSYGDLLRVVPAFLEN